MFLLAGLMGALVLGTTLMIGEGIEADHDETDELDTADQPENRETAFPLPAVTNLSGSAVQPENVKSGDIVAGDETDNELIGTAANDQLNGAAGNDTLSGQGGDDQIIGGDGQDTLAGDAGTDTLHGGAGNDTQSGGPGADLLFGHSGDDQLNGNDGNDTQYGGDGNDTLSGQEGDDALHGGLGNDVLKDGVGSDTLFGGWGDDKVSGIASLSTAATNIDSVPDFLNGGGGNDTLIAGELDILTGGDGTDSFWLGDWISAGSTATILDFDPAEDVLLVIIEDGVSALQEIDIEPSLNNSETFDITLNGEVLALVHATTEITAQNIQMLTYSESALSNQA